MPDLISSAAEALTKADFLRRHGCPRSSDVEVLAAELDEALAECERLREGLEDHIERIVEAVTEAVAMRNCGLAEGERVAGETCRSTEDEDCGACQLEALRREHTKATRERETELAAELQTARSHLDFLTAERDRLLIEIQQRPSAPKSATRAATRTKAAPPGQGSLWDKILAAHTERINGVLGELGSLEGDAPKPKAKRARKPRSSKRWLDPNVALKKTKSARGNGGSHVA